MKGHGQKLSRKQEALIAALLSEPTHAAAAKKVGVSEATLHRWLKDADFQTAYLQARREILRGAVERLQAAAGRAVETLVGVATNDAARDGDRVRAAALILDHASRGLDIGTNERCAPPINGTADVVRVLAVRLRGLDASDLPAAEKARLTAALADTLLRAIGVDVIDKRLEALQAVLAGRRDPK
jgi:hypothetical protein